LKRRCSNARGGADKPQRFEVIQNPVVEGEDGKVRENLCELKTRGEVDGVKRTNRLDRKRSRCPEANVLGYFQQGPGFGGMGQESLELESPRTLNASFPACADDRSSRL